MNDPLKHYPASNRFCAICGTGAVIWIDGGDVCFDHYIELGQKNADRYCNERGLDTTEKKIEHCRGLMRQFVSGAQDKRAWMKNPKSALAARYAAEVRGENPYVPREPGSDDE